MIDIASQLNAIHRKVEQLPGTDGWIMSLGKVGISLTLRQRMSAFFSPEMGYS